MGAITANVFVVGFAYAFILGFAIFFALVGGIENRKFTHPFDSSLVYLVIDVPCSEGDETTAKRCIEVISSLHEPLTTCLYEVLERGFGPSVLHRDFDDIARVSFNEFLARLVAALLHFLPKSVLLIEGEGLRFGERLEDVAHDIEPAIVEPIVEALHGVGFLVDGHR